MSTINRRDLAALLSQEYGCSKDLAAQIVDSLFGVMRKALIDGDRIEVRGFGALQVRDTRAKPGARNPRTGETICVPARRRALFKPGQLLREALHQPRGDRVYGGPVDG